MWLCCPATTDQSDWLIGKISVKKKKSELSSSDYRYIR